MARNKFIEDAAKLGRQAGDAAGYAATTVGNTARDAANTASAFGSAAYRSGEQAVKGAVEGYQQGVNKAQRADFKNRVGRAASGAKAYVNDNFGSVLHPLEKAFITARAKSPTVDQSHINMTRAAKASPIYQKITTSDLPWNKK